MTDMLQKFCKTCKTVLFWSTVFIHGFCRLA